MLDVETVNQLLADSVPFHRVLGPRVESVAPERVTVILPESPERLNHVGSTHAVAQFGLGEVTSGAMTLMAFSDLQRHGYAPVVTSASVVYHKPARGQLRGEASLGAEEQARIRSEIAAGARPRFAIEVRIFDQQETLTTELRFEWTLLTPRVVKG
ncbi:MAG TPA: YiiD C-terminal domain-containing protein [Ktedonobacterales bacterium]|nr:YiiD C-terminal domain-containing protein [Ktedonobacterales bacterium]